MKKFAQTSPILFIAGVGVLCNAQQQHRAPEEGFKLIAGAQYQSDSNFTRTPDGGDEQITRAALGVGYNKNISAQRIALRFTANQYYYAERDYMDENSWEGNASWRSRFSNNTSSLLSFERHETPVDQLEFAGKDMVARDRAKAQLSLGDSRRLGFIIGAHQFRQTHSNEERNYLDLEDQDIYAEIRYRGLASSWVSLRYRSGERSYEFLELLPRNLDFDYRQWEIETHWVLTPKTELTGVAGYFERDGETNNDEGALAGLKLSWQATSKVTTEVAYSLSQPAQGETADSPVEINNVSLMVSWQLTSKIQITSGGSYAEYDYINQIDSSPYLERGISITPLSVEWLMSDAVRFRLHGQWVERSSPIVLRDYDGHIITGGVALAF